MPTKYPLPQPAKNAWTNSKVLVCDVDVSPEAAADLLPGPLKASEPARATVFVADYPDGIFGIVYREAAILLHASDDSGPALHCPWIVVDNDTALIQGRELTGFPKKIAQIELDIADDKAVGSVVRKGVELMRVEATIGDDDAEPPVVFGRRFVNAMGSIVGGMQLVDMTPSETITSSRSAKATVTFGDSIWDPIGRLAPSKPDNAHMVVLDLSGGDAPPAIAGDIDPAWAMRQFFFRSM